MRWFVVTLLVAAPAGAAAQGLAGRVAGVRDGIARITYATRPGVAFCEDGIRLRAQRPDSGWNRGYDEEGVCRSGPARVELDVRDARVRRVRVLRPGEKPTRDAVDLGEVPAGAAARFFLSLARRAPAAAARTAIFAAELAKPGGPPLWRGLLGLARDRDVAPSVRRGAIFWLGQEAGAEVTAGLAGVASDDSAGQGVRDAAIFALSGRTDTDAVSILMHLARTAKQAATRRTAMFWLARSNDPRVPEFFERILLGGAGG